MKKVLGILALLLMSGLAWASSGKSETTSVSAGVATASTPPSASNTTLGISLGQASRGFRITLCAASGQTLSGSGRIKIYLRNSQAGLWAENKDLHKSVVSTERCEVWSDFDSSLLPINTDRIYAAPDVVAVSGGSNVAVYYDACLKTGC